MTVDEREAALVAAEAALPDDSVRPPKPREQVLVENVRAARKEYQARIGRTRELQRQAKQALVDEAKASDALKKARKELATASDEELP
jgi:hypothetical protein